MSDVVFPGHIFFRRYPGLHCERHGQHGVSCASVPSHVPLRNVWGWHVVRHGEHVTWSVVDWPSHVPIRKLPCVHCVLFAVTVDHRFRDGKWGFGYSHGYDRFL